MNSHPFTARGVSLIELMVAMAIGSLLLLGLVQVFSASRAAYATSEGVARVQENARFAIDYLQRDIRMAGHFGCVNDQAHWVKGAADLASHFGTGAADEPTNFNVSIHGYESTNTGPGQTVTLGSATAGWSPGLPGNISALSPLPGSDIIELRYLDNEGVPVTNLTVSGTRTVVAFPAAKSGSLTSDGITAPTMFGVADCASVDVFPTAATNLAVGTVTTEDAIEFSARYTTQPEGQTLLYRAESIVYYVALNTAGTPALFRARFNGTAFATEELVEGIESLQFLYGRDSTTNISAATPPSGTITLQNTALTLNNDANEWRRVGLVQVGVLAQSPNPAGAGSAETASRPRALGVVFNPPVTNDTRYRSSYEVTIALRNRLFGN